MNSHPTKTDNSFLQDKVMLRYNNLPDKEVIHVLDCFAGKNLIWDRIKQMTNKKIEVLPIDKKGKKNLKGENMKFLKSLNLKNYEVIDLDSYGIPFKQLEYILNKGYKGHIFITFIQSMFGGLPNKLLEYNNISPNLYKKIKTIFFKQGFKKFKNYLAKKEIKKIKYKCFKNKYYIYLIEFK